MATKSIGATGRDYATIALWAAYVNALVLIAANERGECYNDSEFTSASKITIGGWTNLGTFTVTLACATGQSFRDNASVQSNALRYNQANGVGLATSTAYDDGLLFNTAYTVIDGLQIKATNAHMGKLLNLSAVNLTIQNCIVQGAGTALIALFAGDTSSVAQNCLALNTTTAGDGIFSVQGGKIFDCTSVSSGGSSGNGIRALYGPAGIAKNNASAGYTTDYLGTADASSTNNATDKGSFGGTNWGGSGQVSLVATTEWQSVTNGSEDLRLKSTSAKLKDNGATVGPSVDIANTSRPQGSAYDIGCWELVAAAAGAFNPYYYREHVARAGG